MPSEQYKRFMEQMPSDRGMPGMEGMPGPGTKDESGEYLIPTMPEGFRPVMPPIPEGFISEEVVVNGINGIRVSGPDVKKDQVFMHIHGGGFTIGSAFFCVPFMLYIVEKLKMECYSVEYSLAPKYKFPTQIDECLAFYKGLVEKGYEKIVIGGESAGGSLSISVAHCIKDNDLPLPAAVIALSPIGDISNMKEVYKRDFLSDMAPLMAEAYACNADLKHPYISPLHGDFKGYPPLLLQAGGDESFASESVRLAEAAARADVDVLLHVWKDMGHCFAQQFDNFPEADSAMEEITNFIRDRMEFGS